METKKTNQLMPLDSPWLVLANSSTDAAAKITAVDNETDFAAAGTLIEDLGKLRKELEAERKKLTAPLDAAKKEIMNREKMLGNVLDEQRERLRGLCGEFATRKAREREEQELARLEAEADAAMAADIFGGTEEQMAMPLVPDRLKSGAVKQVEVYTYVITDESKLDRKFLSVDERKINAFVNYCKSMKINPETIQEPGLKIKKEIRIDGK